MDDILKSEERYSNVCRILNFCIANTWDKLSEDDKIEAVKFMTTFNEMSLEEE